jgi:hypothetical protein
MSGQAASTGSGFVVGTRGVVSVLRNAFQAVIGAGCALFIVWLMWGLLVVLGTPAYEDFKDWAYRSTRKRKYR